MEEIWKDVPGFDRYSLSNTGKLLSKEHTYPHWRGGVRRVKSKLLKPAFDGRYYFYYLYNEEGPKPISLHRLLAMTFLPNPDNLPCVNHKNEITTDNRLENLEWCSYSHNSNWGNRNNKISSYLTNCTTTSKRVAQYTTDMSLINIFPSTKEVQRTLGYANQGISKVCLGKQKTAYGYIWRYV